VRIIPRTLGGQLVALLLLALAPSQAIALAIYASQRAQAVRHAGQGTAQTAIPSVAITIAHQTTQPVIGMFLPRFCLLLRGAKEVTIGERRIRYARYGVCGQVHDH